MLKNPVFVRYRLFFLGIVIVSLTTITGQQPAQSRPNPTQAKPTNPKDWPAATLLAQTLTTPSVEVIEVDGLVTYGSQVVSVGQSLQVGNEELITANQARVRLFINDKIGLVELSENSSLQLSTLSNGEISLFLNRGQVRLSVTTFTQELSQLKSLESIEENTLLAQSRRSYPVNVQTPAGVAGVRGTAFGVNVGPDGKTGISTIRGSVAAIAQGQEIVVNAGEYVVIEPGEGPTPPATVPPRATFKRLGVYRISADAVRVVGEVDPLDILFINGQPVEVEPDGTFSTRVRRPRNRRLKFVIRGPEVRETHYEIAIL